MIFHDMDSIQVEEMVRNANVRFRRFTTDEHHKDEREQINVKPISSLTKQNEEEMVRNANKRLQSCITDEHQKEEREQVDLKPISFSLTKQLNVEKTLTVQIKIPPSSDESESTINDDTDYDLRADFRAETSTNEVHTGDIVSFTALRNPRNLINIEEVNIHIDKTSDAFKEFKLLDRFGQTDSETKRMVCKLCDKSWNGKDRPRVCYTTCSCHEKFSSGALWSPLEPVTRARRSSPDQKRCPQRSRNKCS